MTRNFPLIGLRIPPSLKEKIEAAASAEGRSMNAEIRARIEASFESSSGQGASDGAVAALANALIAASQKHEVDALKSDIEQLKDLMGRMKEEFASKLSANLLKRDVDRLSEQIKKLEKVTEDISPRKAGQ